GSTVNFTGTVTSDCGGVGGANVEFIDHFSSLTYSCSPENGMGNGSYWCPFDTPSTNGWHDVELTATKQYYFPYPETETDYQNRAYYLATEPEIDNPE
ncbi:MAG: hypothetical protein SVU32_07780, partial [Candidatus Nanohaloarchaea archaeon]|nr:hypothetical protein [Candidatus Nanohaloarchaea archaeon]